MVGRTELLDPKDMRQNLVEQLAVESDVIAYVGAFVRRKVFENRSMRWTSLCGSKKVSDVIVIKSFAAIKER